MKKLALLFLLSSALIAARHQTPKEEPMTHEEIHEEYVKIILNQQYFKVAITASAITTMAGIIVGGGMAYALNK